MKNLSCLFLFAFMFLGSAHAQRTVYPFFYFEGDGETPIYLKVEGQMQERYGKNHAIVANLGPGFTNFEILFQQNKYPAQKFYLQVPASGYRGFVLRQVGEQSFALYDLQQHKYIPANNSEEEGAAPDLPLTAANTYQPPADVPVSQPTSGKGKTKTNPKRNASDDQLALLDGDGEVNYLELGKRSKSKKEHQTERSPFIEGMVINDDGSGATDNSPTAPANSSAYPFGPCKEPMDHKVFENVAMRLLAEEGEEKQLRFLRKQAGNYCFSTEQSRIIVKNFLSQSARLQAVKVLYPRTTDVEDFDQLESLFLTPFLKEKFREAIK